MLRRTLRAASTVLIVAGALLIADAALTLAWQEPVSAIYARLQQDHLDHDLRALDRARPTLVELRALSGLRSERQRLAFLARALARRARPGQAVARIRIHRTHTNFVVVQGTEPDALRKGPGHYPATPLPGARGTVAIAGHRTTYLAPFRHIDALRPGDFIELEMPYGVFSYEVEYHRIVPPSEVSVTRRAGYDRLVLTACHPLYSAAKRIVVFARLAGVVPRGAGLTASRPS